MNLRRRVSGMAAHHLLVMLGKLGIKSLRRDYIDLFIDYPQQTAYGRSGQIIWSYCERIDKIKEEKRLKEIVGHIDF